MILKLVTSSQSNYSLFGEEIESFDFLITDVLSFKCIPNIFGIKLDEDNNNSHLDLDLDFFWRSMMKGDIFASYYYRGEKKYFEVHGVYEENHVILFKYLN